MFGNEINCFFFNCFLTFLVAISAYQKQELIKISVDQKEYRDEWIHAFVCRELVIKWANSIY